MARSFQLRRAEQQKAAYLRVAVVTSSGMACIVTRHYAGNKAGRRRWAKRTRAAMSRPAETDYKGLSGESGNRSTSTVCMPLLSRSKMAKLRLSEQWTRTLDSGLNGAGMFYKKVFT